MHWIIRDYTNSPSIETGKRCDCILCILRPLFHDAPAVEDGLYDSMHIIGLPALLRKNGRKRRKDRKDMGIRWIYGRQDWKTLERGQENCYLMTNGLGGFSSLTMTGSAARNDHAFLMACMKAPNNRYNIIHRLAEKLEIKDAESMKSYTVSSQEFADGSREEGYRYLTEFVYEDTPIWRFLVNGVEIEKEAAVRQNENTIAVCYRVKNRSRSAVCLSVTPFCQFSPKGEEPDPQSRIVYMPVGAGISCEESGGLKLYCMTDGSDREIPQAEEVCYYAYDVCDGRRSTGRARACHSISLSVESGCEKTLSIVFSMEEKYACMHFSEEKSENGELQSVRELAESVIEELKESRGALEAQSGLKDETARCLVKSAHQFISRRESTGKETILAGFPFFEDWGRDTMIALPGICLSTRRFGDAASILRTFARYERNGLMPNLFPEGKNEPMYNTVDAALLFINCVWLYYKASGDEKMLEEMYPVMERIIDSYMKGTDYDIRMDGDGLITAGSGLDQVTWMDVRVGEILPTPRHGKPVEINAYWYNALRIMGACARLLCEKDSGCTEASEVMGWLSDSLVVVSGRDPKVSVPVRDGFIESLGRDLERLDTGIGRVEAVHDMTVAPSGPDQRHDVMVTDIRSGTATIIHPDGSASELGFVHEHGHVSRLHGESHGTARLVMLLSLMSVPSGGRTAVVDDLDMSLHMLAAREVLSAAKRAEGLQLLCTVSETDLVRCGLVGHDGMAVIDMLGGRGRRGSQIRMVCDYRDAAENVFDDYADGRYGSLPIFSDPVLE